MAPSREHLIHRACVEAGFEPQIAYVTRDPLAIGELVGAGLAVTLVPELLAARLSGVAVVALEDRVPRRAVYALTPAAGVRPAARAFVAAARAGIERRVSTSKPA
jgi:DNA-binding transcriptional LysR family regulator